MNVAPQIAIIVKQYEEHHMGVDEINEEFPGLEKESIKSILAQYSKMYRDDMKGGALAAGDDFTSEEAALAKQTIAHVMLTSDDDNLKLRAAKYIRDDKKGRLDIVQGMKNLHINVVTFNANMQKVLAARERTLKLVKENNNGPSIEVVPTNVE